MALRKRPIALTLGPMNTKLDDKTTSPGAVFEAENVYLVKGANQKGEYRKRFGCAALATACTPSGSLGTVSQLATYKGALCSLGKTAAASISTYSAALGKFAASGKAEPNLIRSKIYGPVTSRRIPIATQDTTASGGHARRPDAAFLPTDSNQQIIAYEDGQGNIVEIGFDFSTNTRLWRNTYAGMHPRLEVNATEIFLVYYDNIAGAINLRRFAAAQMATGSPTVVVLATDTVTTGKLDTCMYAFHGSVGGALTTLCVAYRHLTDIKLVQWDATGGDNATATITTGAELCDIALGWLPDIAGSGLRYLGTAQTVAGFATVRVRTIDVALTVTINDSIEVEGDARNSDVRNITGYSTTSNFGNYVVMWEVGGLTPSTATPASANVPSLSKIKYNVLDGNVKSWATSPTWMHGMGLRSRPFLYLTSAYVITIADSLVQPTHFLHRVPDVPDLIAGPPLNIAPICKTHQWSAFRQYTVQTSDSDALVHVGVGGTSAVCALGRSTAATAMKDNATTKLATRFETGVDWMIFTFDPVFSAFGTNGATLATGVPVEAADVLLVPQGGLHEFDGLTFSETGFHLYPEPGTNFEDIAGVQTDTGAAGLRVKGVATGATLATYSVACVYKFVDAQGRVHRSAPTFSESFLADPAGGASAKIVYYPTLRLSGRRISAVTDMQIEIYMTVANGSTFYLYRVFDNDPTLDEGSFSIAGSVFSLSAGPYSATEQILLKSTALYTTGNVLENDPAPQFKTVWNHNGRVFGIPADDPRTIWFSKLIVPGLGVEFNSDQVITIDDEWGDCTGGASDGTTCVIFKRNAIYALSGEGPDNEGNGFFPNPRRISADLGSLGARGIVVTSQGVWFPSELGPALLNRGYSASLVEGAPVDDWATLTIVDAVHVDSLNEVRFATSSGRTLVHNYLFGAWYTRTGETTTAMCSYGTQVAMVSPGSSARIVVTSSSLYTDEGVGYRCKIATGWISLGGVAGGQFIYEMLLVGSKTQASNADIELDLFYNYENVTAFEQRQITPPANGSSDNWTVSHKPKMGRHQCVKLVIYDGRFGTATASIVDFRLSDVTLVFGVLKQGHLPGASRLVALNVE